MNLKKLLLMSVATCLSLPMISTANSGMITPMELAQRHSCNMDDVDLRNGPQTVSCTWGEESSIMQMTLHAGQTREISASCNFTPAAGSFDVVGDVEGEKAASIKDFNKHANPIPFTVVNDNSSPNLNVRIFLNSDESYKTQFSRFISRKDVKYTPGDAISCVFTPLATMKD